MDWVLRERTLDTKQIVTKIIKEHLDRLSKGTVSQTLCLSFTFNTQILISSCGKLGRTAESVIQWYSGEENFSDAFLNKIRAKNASYNKTKLADAIFAAIISTVPLYSLAITHVVDFFLQGEQTTGIEGLMQAIEYESQETDAVIFNYACEALSEPSFL